MLIKESHCDFINKILSSTALLYIKTLILLHYIYDYLPVRSTLNIIIILITT